MQFARFCALVIAFVLFPAPHSIKSQEPPSGRVAPIRRLPGYEEGKRQADIEREEVESRRAAPEPEVFAPTPRAAVISEGFAGMNFNDTLGFVPPDTHAATGPSHILETVNTTFSIYNRTTKVRVSGPNDLASFFGLASNHFLTDPVVAYDEIDNRFYIGVLDLGTNDPSASVNLLYAVSDDADPTNGFTEKHSISLTESGNSLCPGSVTVGGDFTRTGWNADAHVFTFNMFALSGTCPSGGIGNTFDHVTVIVIHKSTVLDKNNGTLTADHVDRSGSDNFTLTPTVMHGASTGDPMWFVESVFSNQIRIVKMANVLGPTPTFAEF